MSKMLGSETKPASLAPVGVQLNVQPAVSQGSPMWLLQCRAVLTAARAGTPAKGSSASSSEPRQTRHLESPALVSLPGELTWARPAACPIVSPRQASLGHSVKTRVCWLSLCLLLLSTRTLEGSRRGPALRKLHAVGESGSHKRISSEALCWVPTEPRAVGLEEGASHLPGRLREGLDFSWAFCQTGILLCREGPRG